MPPLFTRLLAESLTTKGSLPIGEAIEGAVVLPGRGWIAPGDYHLTVDRSGAAVRLHTSQDPPEHFCRPAVDVLFRSIARVYGRHALAVVLTGMGKDGLLGCREIRRAGGQILVQDEATSVVWSMPGHVANEGLADRVLPIDQIGAEIAQRVRAKRGLADRRPLHGLVAGPCS